MTAPLPDLIEEAPKPAEEGKGRKWDAELLWLQQTIRGLEDFTPKAQARLMNWLRDRVAETNSLIGDL